MPEGAWSLCHSLTMPVIEGVPGHHQDSWALRLAKKIIASVAILCFSAFRNETHLPHSYQSYFDYCMLGTS